MKKIIITLLAVLVTIGLIGIGTYAYFTDIAVSGTNTLQAGTLSISVDETTSVDWTINNIKPGDKIEGFVRLVNDGSLPISVITGNLVITSDITPNRSEAGGFADVIEVTRIEYITPDGSHDGNEIAKYYAVFGDKSAPLTLQELADGWPEDVRKDANWYFAVMKPGYWTNTNTVLMEPGQGVRMYLDMEFMTPDPPGPWNEYQAASLAFQLKFMALQVGAPMPSSADTSSPAHW